MIDELFIIPEYLRNKEIITKNIHMNMNIIKNKKGIRVLHS
jgi:hypothetical protein